MSDDGASAVTVVEPGGGTSASLRTIGVVFKLSGAETGGALAIVEHPFPPGALVPPHVHSREDEFSIVLEGEIGFRSGDREAVLGPGGYIAKPRGELHTMWNAGTEPARMIEVISPAGLENYFRQLAALLAAGPPNPAEIAELSDRYGLRYPQPDWLPDLISRYSLTPPPRPE
jgi:uncharacterized cupin superfamily protein